MPTYYGMYGGGAAVQNEKLARCLRKHKAKRKRRKR